ncbi:MAG: hypothetical protein K9I70_10175 [Chitinophagaceae bacterium]|jgi:hypothetical protein|nr:hypothetical protein [Chitinophagaceae bacterium]
MTIAIKDENFSGSIIHEINLDFQQENVTVRDIITQRVIHEVENYNQKLPAYFNGLVEPSDAEKTINGFKLTTRKMIDAEKQVYVALDAFTKNGYFLLIDTIQSESLEQEVFLKSTTSISFIKLTPLVGG